MKSMTRSVSYTALDHFTGGRGVPRTIGGESIRFPARWSRYYNADYEPATFHFLREWCRPRDTVLDIGAHIGLFTVLLSRIVGPAGRVFSFEPTPFTCDVLRETIRLNGCEANVHVYQKAVTAETGWSTFFETGDVVSNANSLVRTGRSKSAISVKAVSVDDLVRPEDVIHLLKIDVEGAELDVLRGARRTIERSKPAVHLGLHPLQIEQSGGSLEEIWSLLGDYRLTVFSDGERVGKSWFCEHDDLFDVQATPSSWATGREGRADLLVRTKNGDRNV